MYISKGIVHLKTFTPAFGKLAWGLCAWSSFFHYLPLSFLLICTKAFRPTAPLISEKGSDFTRCKAIQWVQGLMEELEALLNESAVDQSLGCAENQSWLQYCRKKVKILPWTMWFAMQKILTLSSITVSFRLLDAKILCGGVPTWSILKAKQRTFFQCAYLWKYPLMLQFYQTQLQDTGCGIRSFWLFQLSTH